MLDPYAVQCDAMAYCNVVAIRNGLRRRRPCHALATSYTHPDERASEGFVAALHLPPAFLSRSDTNSVEMAQGTSLRFPLVGYLPVDHGHFHPDVFDLLLRAAEVIAVQHGYVGQEAGRQRPFDALLAREPGA
jgi:hypothetical protein